MNYVGLSDLKNHLNLTADEIDFDSELPRHLRAAIEVVRSFLNRGVYESLPVEPDASDIEVNDSINRAVLEIAGYYFDAKGAVDRSMVNNMLMAFVGHLRLEQF